MYFILWVLIQDYCYLFCYSDYPGFGHQELLWVLFCVLRTHPIVSSVLPCFLTVQHFPSSSCVFLAAVLDQPFLQEALVPSYWRMILKTKIWVLGMLHGHRDHDLWVFSADKYVYLSTGTHTPAFVLSVSLNVCTHVKKQDFRSP